MKKTVGRIFLALALFGFAVGCEAGEFTSDQTKDTAVNGDEDLQTDSVDDPADDPQDDDPGQPDLPAETVQDPAVDPAPDPIEDPPVEEEPAPRTYPPGPYGTAVGSTMANLSFTDSHGWPVDMNSFYQNDALKVLLIFSTAPWCPTCSSESETLPSTYSTYSARGFQIMAAVFEDDYQNPADARDAAAYASAYGFTFPTVADPQSKISMYYQSNTVPFNMLVDVTTMKILYKVHNFDYSIDRTLKSKIDNYLNTITR